MIETIRLTKKTRCTSCRRKLIDGESASRLISPKGKVAGTFCMHDYCQEEAQRGKGQAAQVQ